MTNPLPSGLTLDDVEGVIAKTQYTLLSDGRTTICQLTLKNGFTVIGESSVIDATKFDAQIGRNFARDRAVGRIWDLEGYLLKQRRFEAGL